MYKQIAAIIAVAFIMTACKTNVVTMSVTEPAPVTLPGTIKKIGIVDRTRPSEEAERLNRIDEVLTIEGFQLDREGAIQSISGAQDELLKNKRFEAILNLDSVVATSSASGSFPPQLSWDVIEQMCTKNGVDAIFVLELFDTDTKIDYRAIPVTLKGPLGVEIPAIEHEAKMIVTVKSGWRIYDPQSKRVLDEVFVAEDLVRTGRGINPIKAAAALMDRKDAVKQVAYIAGKEYAQRILPYRIRVSRKYYVKGSRNLEAAKRKAQTGNWDGAGDLWLEETTNGKAKVEARACYNMAIIAEINGDLDIAVEWAQKSYEDYGNKLALSYVRILKRRIARNERLQRQLEDQ